MDMHIVEPREELEKGEFGRHEELIKGSEYQDERGFLPEEK